MEEETAFNLSEFNKGIVISMKIAGIHIIEIESSLEEIR